MPALANDNIVYFGAGAAKDKKTSTTTDKTPFSIGYLSIREDRNLVWGLDYSREGSVLDSTYSQRNAVKQSNSYNLLLGRNLSKFESGRLDVALLLGAREKTKDCPNSFLGYQCYANTEPNVEHSFNFGVVATWSFSKLTIGIRATGESTQAMMGVRF